MSNVSSFACRLLMGLILSYVPGYALAKGGERSVGGHVGIATPLVTIPSEGDTTDIGDQFTLVAPVGVTVKTGGPIAIDFEIQVANPVDPSGNTALVVAPGLVYNFGVVAAGLRLASEIGAPANVGVIPIVNKGLAPAGGGTWFVEAAFPMFVHSEPPDFTFTVVIHTGIGF